MTSDAISQYIRERRRGLNEAGLCSTCGKNPCTIAGRCQACIDKERKRNNKERLEAAASGRCYSCKIRSAATGKKRCQSCIDKAAEYNRTYRDKALLAYGGFRCSCPGCDVTNKRFLTLDHINNDGAKDRAKGVGASGVGLYRRLMDEGYPPGFQVLCYNCNCGRAVNGGICPHITDPQYEG